MRDLKIYLAIASFLLIAYLFAQYNKPRPINWTPTFSREHKIPFGTFVCYNQLKDIFPASDVEPVRKAPYLTFTEASPGNGNYILLANTLKIDMYDFRELKKYVEQGNNALIAAFYLSDYFRDSLKTKVNSELKLKDSLSVPITFVDRNVSRREYRFDKGIGDQYFSSFDTARAEILARNANKHPVFLKYRFGKGAIYMVASPYFFTNYNLLKPEGAEYASKLLSYLPDRGKVIWDEFSSLGSEEVESPLRVILSHEGLRQAYYLALFSLILFVLFEIKRRQRVIPVLEPLKNTSVEFVKVVGQVYYQQRNNQNIAKKKVTYFLEEIRTRYLLKLDLGENDFVENLSKKSGVNEEFTYELVVAMRQVEQSNVVTDSKLIELNKLIEQFKQRSK